MEENKKEKKQIKISLGTAICIFIIILLVLALAGTIIYYNSKIDKENIVERNKTDSVSDEKNNTIILKEEEKRNEEEHEQEEILEDIVNAEEFYVYDSSTSNNKEKDETSDKFTKIGFSSDGKFLIEMLPGYFDTVTGKYELIDENTRRCKLEKYSCNAFDGRETYSLKDADFFIDFEVIDNKKLKVVANNMSDLEGEFAITMHVHFPIGDRFSKYDIKDFMGEWNTKYVYVRDEDTNYGYRKEEGLTAVFGTSVLGIGSNITFEEDGSFLDYIWPITENDTYRTGVYTFENGNEITLKYKEGETLSIYIISDDTLAYHDGNDIMILQR